MKKEEIFIRAQQKIQHLDSKKRETFQFSGQGTLITLRTYSKLTYRETNDTLVELKWPADKERLEISRQGNKLYLIPHQVVEVMYRAEGLETMLKIETQNLKMTDSCIDVRYHLSIGDQILGRYHYRTFFRRQ